MKHQSIKQGTTGHFERAPLEIFTCLSRYPRRHHASLMKNRYKSTFVGVSRGCVNRGKRAKIPSPESRKKRAASAAPCGAMSPNGRIATKIAFSCVCQPKKKADSPTWARAFSNTQVRLRPPDAGAAATAVATRAGIIANTASPAAMAGVISGRTAMDTRPTKPDVGEVRAWSCRPTCRKGKTLWHTGRAAARARTRSAKRYSAQRFAAQ